jgi:hypothetical protein
VQKSLCFCQFEIPKIPICFAIWCGGGVKLVFGKSYGKATRDLAGHPAEPSTSKHYLDYAENRPLIVNEFELKHPLHYNHFKLTDPGEGSLGPLPEGARPRSPSEDMFPLAQN